jgi:protein SCO1/2
MRWSALDCSRARRSRGMPTSALGWSGLIKGVGAGVGMAPGKLALLVVALVAFVAVSSSAQPSSTDILKSVRIDQNLGAQLPLDSTFRDEAGRDVRLGEFFGSRPVLLNFVYFKCPGLCTQALTDLSRTLNGLAESAGEQFDVITISFDPSEGPELAREKKASYLRGYRRPKAAAGWHFLTGSADSIARVTQAAGFHYKWDAVNKVFAHATAILVVTPGGKISRYFYGVEAPPTDVKNAIVAAAGDSIGKPREIVLLYCFHYDPATGKWGFIVSRALKVLGVLTILIVGGFIWLQVAREQRRSAVGVRQ